MISVVLNSNVVQAAKRGANKRNATASRQSLNNHRVSKESDYDANLLGLLGELAFSRLMGIRMATDIDQVDLYDFVLPDGRTVDVKHTKYRNGTLAIIPNKSMTRERLADLYVLTTGKEPVIDVVGYIEGEILWDNYSYHPKIKKMRRWLPQEGLKPIEELVKY